MDVEIYGCNTLEPSPLIGDYRSVVDAITVGYLYALEVCPPYNFDEKTSFHCLNLEMKEKFMSIERLNYLYHQFELNKIKKKKCPGCMYRESGLCPQSFIDLERCFKIAEAKRYADLAAPFWEST